MIRDRGDLIDWLKENGLFSEALDVPEVKPYKKSKWSYIDGPDWLYDDLSVNVGRLHKESIGECVQVFFTAEQQDRTVRLKFARSRGTNVARIGTCMKSLGEILLPESDFEACESLSELIAKVQPGYKYQIKEV